MCFSIYFEERPKLESSASDPLWGAILDQHLAKIVPKTGTKNDQKTANEFAMVSASSLVTFGTLLGAQNGSQNCSANLRGRSGGTRWPSRTPPGPFVTHCELDLVLDVERGRKWSQNEPKIGPKIDENAGSVSGTLPIWFGDVFCLTCATYPSDKC